MPWRDLLRPFRRAPQPAAASAAASRPRPPVAISRPSGRPTWALAGFDYLLTPFGRVPTLQNYGLYASLRETIPILDAAIHKTIQFVGTPLIDADPETKQEIEAWLSSVHVNRIQSGWTNWLATWLDNALTYGRSHTEIILTADRRDVYALMELHPATIQLHPTSDRYSVQIVQYQAVVGEPVLLNPLLMLNAVHHIQGDDPNGTSLMWGLPFVAEIISKMVNALGNTWDRFGVPRYHINWDPPDGFSDPDGTQSADIMSGIAGQFNQALLSAKEQDVRDFYSSGKVTVSIIGAEGEAMDFETPMRSLVEQVVAKTGIPPMAFGLQWSTTERMSAVQAGLLSSMIDHLRAEIESELTYLITFRQQLVGGDTAFKLCWPPASLLDDMDTARARLFDEQARQTQIANEQKLWELGINTVYDVVRAVREDMDELDDAEIRQRLPDLQEAPPAAMAPPPGAAPLGGAPAGNNPSPALMDALASLNGRGH